MSHDFEQVVLTMEEIIGQPSLKEQWLCEIENSVSKILHPHMDDTKSNLQHIDDAPLDNCFEIIPCKEDIIQEIILNPDVEEDVQSCEIINDEIIETNLQDSNKDEMTEFTIEQTDEIPVETIDTTVDSDEITKRVDEIIVESPDTKLDPFETLDEEIENPFETEPIESFQDHPFYPACQKQIQVLAFLHGTTLVNTPDGQKPIYELRKNDEIMKSDGEIIKVVELIKTLPQVNYIRFGKGSLQCRPPNQEPSMDLYVSPTAWFLYKHTKAMDCENIMNGNSISRTTIEMPADCFLILTEHGDYIKVADIDVLTYPYSLFLEWYRNQKGKNSDSIIVAIKTPEAKWNVL